jgi:hypothetical protein
MPSCQAPAENPRQAAMVDDASEGWGALGMGVVVVTKNSLIHGRVRPAVLLAVGTHRRA